jgi:AcrR family transcriptional regulator
MPSARPSGTRSYDATRRRAAADVRREKVVEAAIDLFQERGWSGTRLVDVAEAAGVSTELVAKAFNGKPGLLMAAMRAASFGEHANLQEAFAALRLGDLPGLEDRLVRLADFVVGSVGPMSPMLSVLSVASDQDTQLRALLTHARANHVKTCAECVTVITEAPAEPEQVAEMVLLTRAETWLMMVDELAWTPAQYRVWFLDRLRAVLLR